MIYLGIDIGSLYIKTSGFVDKQDVNKLDDVFNNNSQYKWTNYETQEGKFFVVDVLKVSGNPKLAVKNLINKIYADFGENNISGISLVGAGSKLCAQKLDLKSVTEFKAIAEAFTTLFPKVSSIFEIGGENSKYLFLKDGLIVDYEANADCAAGTGSFIDQQASRLKFEVEEIGNIAINTEKSPVIAGRCSVFAKSDMIHAQQKGYTPAEILKGLCNTISINFKGNLLKGKDISTPLAFIGGVSLNSAVVKHMKETFGLNDTSFIVPEFSNYFVSFGACIVELKRLDHVKVESNENVSTIDENFPVYEKLDMNNVVLLRDQVAEYVFKEDKVDAFIGIDVGSVSTNLVVLDKNGDLIKEIYLLTSGRPIEVVSNGLQMISDELGSRLNIMGTATTGSGRELIGELIGADFVKDEITAHKTGSSFISNKFFDQHVDTIFEIGGQDSKYISLKETVVVDFHMNEACSAGTGSFLQEQAEKLNINIKGEFSDLALKAENPINLGDRCTVFIEKDLNSFQQKGATIENLLAGLAYSIVNNYLRRVVKERKVGDVVYFQGGTAYNDAVAAAFSKVLGKKIIVPPYNGVMGAVGVALISKNEYEKAPYITKFRGYDISKIKFSLKEFTCNACSNQCDIQEFNVEGKKTYWGDKCSEKFRKAVKTGLKPVIKDLFFEREKLLLEAFNNYNSGDKNLEKKTIGFPRAMYYFDRLPFWSSFFGELGFSMVLSDPTNKKISVEGIETVVADPCFPIKVTHGHVANLIDKNPDYILLPYMVTGECVNSTAVDKKLSLGRKQSYFCPWGQTLPDVIKSNKKFLGFKDRFISPKLELREDDEFVINDLLKSLKPKFSWINYSDVKKAYHIGKMNLEKFKIDLSSLYEEALDVLDKTGREAILIVGRPYNVNDKGINLSLPSKLRELYGVNVIPIDFIPVGEQNIDDINDNMFWGYGTRILATLKKIRNRDNIHVIYITNFQCGPDSYIKHFAPEAVGRSFLTLQFDGHGNDAGMITRCEAYLDSKGVF